MDSVPNKDDYSAWIDHIQNLIHDQMGIKLRVGDTSTSSRDALVIERSKIVGEIDYWNRRGNDSDEATLERYEKIADHFKEAALIALKSPADEATEIFSDLSAFGKQLANGATPKAYGDRIFVGRSLITFFLQHKKWPGRRKLCIHLECANRPITRSSLDSCLEYFRVRHIVRDNEKG